MKGEVKTHFYSIFIIYFVYYNFKKPFNCTKGLLGLDICGIGMMEKGITINWMESCLVRHWKMLSK